MAKSRTSPRAPGKPKGRPISSRAVTKIEPNLPGIETPASPDDAADSDETGPQQEATQIVDVSKAMGWRPDSNPKIPAKRKK
jgi:hypothetical protein